MVRKLNPKLWDFWSKRYTKLWVQKWVLGPSRENVINRLNNLKPDNKISLLDMGCGIGQLCGEIKREFPHWQIKGIDISTGMIEKANQNFPSNNITFEVKGIHEETDHYDVITTTHSFPYVLHKESVLKQIFSLLKPGGRILMAMGNSDTLYDKIALGIVKLTTWDSEYPSSTELVNMLDSQGFVSIKKEKMKLPFFVSSVYLIQAQKPSDNR